MAVILAGVEMASVKIYHAHRGYRVDAGIQRAHGCRQRRRDHQAGNACGQVIGDEVGHQGFGASLAAENGAGLHIRVDLKEDP